MLNPKFTLEEIPVGRGCIIGRDNIEEFFTHVSMDEDFEDIPLLKTAPTYESASACLIHMLETRFVNLNPIIQHMFLTLSDMEMGEKRNFVLKVLVREFEDIVKEARKVFIKHKRLGFFPNFKQILEKMDMDRIKYTNNVNDGREIKAPIPSKLLGMHEALENNYAWLVPENLFDENSKPRSNERGVTYIDQIQCIVEKTPNTPGNDVDASTLDVT
jgi:hypothetical protein